MTLPLYKHQEELLRIARDRKRYLIAAEPGTGKTPVGLLILWKRLHEWGESGPSLVLCPKSIIEPAWLEDAKKFTPELRIESGMGGRAKRDEQMKRLHDGELDALVMGYESFLASEKRWPHVDCLICDESTKIKSHSAKISKAVWRWAASASRMHCFSGCPTPNRTEEIWSQMHAIGQGRIFSPSYFAWRHKYFYQPSAMQTWLWVKRGGADREISQIVKQHAIYIKKEECLDLPGQVFEKRMIDLGPQERKIYREFMRRLIVELDQGTLVGMSALSQAMKGRQITAGLAQVGFADNPVWEIIGQSKLNAVGELLEEIPSRNRVLILGQFRKEIERLADEYNGLVFYGGQSDATRRETLRAFASGDKRVLVGPPASMGHGLSFPGVTHTIWASLDYDRDKYLQANERTYGIGRGDRRVSSTYYILLAQDTIDTKVWGCLSVKKHVTSAVLEELRREFGKSRLTA